MPFQTRTFKRGVSVVDINQIQGRINDRKLRSHDPFEGDPFKVHSFRFRYATKPSTFSPVRQQETSGGRNQSPDRASTSEEIDALLNRNHSNKENRAPRTQQTNDTTRVSDDQIKPLVKRISVLPLSPQSSNTTQQTVSETTRRLSHENSTIDQRPFISQPVTMRRRLGICPSNHNSIGSTSNSRLHSTEPSSNQRNVNNDRSKCHVSIDISGARASASASGGGGGGGGSGGGAGGRSVGGSSVGGSYVGANSCIINGSSLSGLIGARSGGSEGQRRNPPTNGHRPNVREPVINYRKTQSLTIHPNHRVLARSFTSEGNTAATGSATANGQRPRVQSPIITRQPQAMTRSVTSGSLPRHRRQPVTVPNINISTPSPTPNNIASSAPLESSRSYTIHRENELTNAEKPLSYENLLDSLPSTSTGRPKLLARQSKVLNGMPASVNSLTSNHARKCISQISIASPRSKLKQAKTLQNERSNISSTNLIPSRSKSMQTLAQRRRMLTLQDQKDFKKFNIHVTVY